MNRLPTIEPRPLSGEDLIQCRNIPGYLEGLYVPEAGARLALFDNPAIRINGASPAVLGAFRPGDDEAAFGHVLDRLLDEARRRGYRYAIGPMDGSTWRSYRLVTEDSGIASFFLEPSQPVDRAGWWVRRGFYPIKTYHSALATDLSFDAAALTHFTAHFGALGLQLRPLQLDEPTGELARLYRFNQAAFAENFLFTPITEAEFIEMYRPLWPHLRSELVWLAETSDGQLAGLAFILHDHLDPTGRTAIFKTLARAPDVRYQGLGEWLCLHALEQLQVNGYTRLIHALMSDDNASTRRSQQFAGHCIRRYALFGKDL